MNISTQIPEVSHDRDYSKKECLIFAISHYHAELQQNLQEEKSKKPVILRIAAMYGVPESTLRRHIKNPGQKTLDQIHATQQALTVQEEAVLVERLLFLDDFNVAADRVVLYTLAHKLLHEREAQRTLGHDWIYRFLAKHNEIRYVIVKAIATSRANAVSWDMMDDFFGKVCKQKQK